MDEIVMVVDKSGSMAHKAQDAIGGMNTFIKDQQKVPKECNLSIYFFDTDFIPIRESISMGDAPLINDSIYSPGGMTALLDAVGKSIDDLSKRLFSRSKQPEHVIFVIVTDGQENSSKEYKLDQIKSLVKEKENQGWKFIFLGAGTDEFAETQGLSMGFSGGVGSGTLPGEVRASYDSASVCSTNIRKGK